jgi:hypothetical protein
MSANSIWGKSMFLATTAWLALVMFGTACGTEASTLGFGGGAATIPIGGTAQPGAGGVTGSTVNPMTGAGGKVIAAGGSNVSAGGKAGTKKASSGGAGGKKQTGKAGAGGSPSKDGGVAGAAGAAGVVTPTKRTHEELGEGDGQDVITIGDSWMNYAVNGGGIEAGLDRVTGKRYRHSAVAGTTVLSEIIPGMYATAKRLNPDIKTVIMTGGGNDVIMDPTMAPQCAAGAPACEDRLRQVAARLGELWNQMSADGVRDVIYINYSEGAGTGTGGVDGEAIYREVILKIPPPMAFHPFATTEIVDGRLVDGIHPTVQACTDIAQGVYDLMKAKGMRR